MHHNCLPYLVKRSVYKRKHASAPVALKIWGLGTRQLWDRYMLIHRARRWQYFVEIL